MIVPIIILVLLILLILNSIYMGVTEDVHPIFIGVNFLLILALTFITLSFHIEYTKLKPYQDNKCPELEKIENAYKIK